MAAVDESMSACVATTVEALHSAAAYVARQWMLSRLASAWPGWSGVGLAARGRVVRPSRAARSSPIKKCTPRTMRATRRPRAATFTPFSGASSTVVVSIVLKTHLT